MFENVLEKIILLVSALFGFLFGAYDLPLMILLTLMTTDFATGILRGFKTKTLNSTKCREGIYGKAAVFIMIILAVMIDMLLNLEGVTRTAVIFFYIVSEGISILENVAQIGVAIPQAILNALEKVKEIGGVSADMKKEEDKQVK